MIIEEIHSYFIYEERGMIYVEFTVCEDDICDKHELEIPMEDLEEICDLFDEREWFEDSDDDLEITTIKTDIDETQLIEGLHIYINQNKSILEY